MFSKYSYSIIEHYIHLWLIEYLLFMVAAVNNQPGIMQFLLQQTH